MEKPATFPDIKSTGIPSLQNWCLQLTQKFQGRAATKFANRLISFCKEVEGYVADLNGVSQEDRLALCMRWDTDYANSHHQTQNSDSDSDSTYIGSSYDSSSEESDDKDSDDSSVSAATGITAELKQVSQFESCAFP
jgi:hypothetical protein